MIVLYHKPIGKAKAIITATADFDGPFLEETEQWLVHVVVLSAQRSRSPAAAQRQRRGRRGAARGYAA